MGMIRLLLGCACIISLCLPGRFVAAQEDSEVLSPDVFVRAKPIDRVEPNYPFSKALAGREGWVLLSFVVSTDGSPMNLMIEDSSGSEAFEESAKAAIAKWQYQPATLNGKPIEESMAQVRIVFEMADHPTGVSQRFKKAFVAINELIQAGQFEVAGKKLTEWQYKERFTLSEDAWYWWLDYMYLDAKGNSTDSDLTEALQRAIGYDNDYLPADVFVTAASKLIVLEIRTFNFSSAKSTYARLLGSKTARKSKYFKEMKSKLDDRVTAIDKMLAGEKILAINARIGQHSYWVHKLLRRSFSLEKIHGTVNGVEVRCDRRYVRYETNAQNKRWTVPANLGDCGVYVAGDPGTTFSYYSYPNGAG